MKKLILGAVVLALLSGCAVVKVTKDIDGDCDAFYMSAFKDFGGIKMSGCGAEGQAETSETNPLMDALIRGLVTE